jgi:hypothetical protein
MSRKSASARVSAFRARESGHERAARHYPEPLRIHASGCVTSDDPARRFGSDVNTR